MEMVPCTAGKAQRGLPLPPGHLSLWWPLTFTQLVQEEEERPSLLTVTTRPQQMENMSAQALRTTLSHPVGCDHSGEPGAAGLLPRALGVFREAQRRGWGGALPQSFFGWRASDKLGCPRRQTFSVPKVGSHKRTRRGLA